MTRHSLQRGKTEIVVGWDPPVQSYFIQEFDKTAPEDDEGVIAYIPRCSLEDCIDYLRVKGNLEDRLIEVYRSALMMDRENTRPPTRLQQQVVMMLEGSED